MAFDRILALTDLSERSRAGLEMAGSLARRLHARVIIGHVHTAADFRRELGTDASSAEHLATLALKEARERLRRIALQSVPRTSTDRLEMLAADSAREGIPRLVERVGPDLCCLAAHGRTGGGHTPLGSIAEQAIRVARLPVMVAKDRVLPEPEQPLRVLVALDLMADPARLARKAASFLGPEDELLLVHVVAPSPYADVDYGPDYLLPQPDLTGLAAAAKMRLEGVVFPENAPRVSIEVRMGPPGGSIVNLEREWRPHVVVARTHGRRSFDTITLGSVSEFIARMCKAAVLIYPKFEKGG